MTVHIHTVIAVLILVFLTGCGIGRILVNKGHFQNQNGEQVP